MKPFKFAEYTGQSIVWRGASEVSYPVEIVAIDRTRQVIVGRVLFSHVDQPLVEIKDTTPDFFFPNEVSTADKIHTLLNEIQQDIAEIRRML